MVAFPLWFLGTLIIVTPNVLIIMSGVRDNDDYNRFLAGLSLEKLWWLNQCPIIGVTLLMLSVCVRYVETINV